jgi:hypothetical protein
MLMHVPLYRLNQRIDVFKYLNESNVITNTMFLCQQYNTGGPTGRMSLVLYIII